MADVSFDLARSSVTSFIGTHASGKTAILSAMETLRRAMMNPNNAILFFSKDSAENKLIQLGNEYDGHEDKIFLDLHPSEYIPLSMKSSSCNIILEGFFEISEDEKNLFRFLYKIDSSIPIGTKKNPLSIKVTFECLSGLCNIRKVELCGFDFLPEDKKNLTLEIMTHALPDILHLHDSWEISELIFLEEEKRHQLQKRDRVFNSYFVRVLDSIVETSIGSGALSVAKILEKIRSKKETEIAEAKQIVGKIGIIINERVGTYWEAVFNSRMTDKIVLDLDVEREAVVIMGEISGYVTSISWLSQSVREFLCLMIFTYLRGQHQKINFAPGSTIKDVVESFSSLLHHRGTLLLFDEPGSTLNASAQEVLIGRFEAMVAEGRLVVYSTHNYNMIRPSWIEGAYVITTATNKEKYKDFGEIKVAECIPYKSFAIANPGESTYFAPILNVVGYKRSEMESFHGVFIVEGKTDYYLIQFFKEVIFAKHKRFSKIRISPAANGASGIGELISFCIGQEVKFKVMLDGDEAGEKAKLMYLREYPLQKSQVFCISDMDLSFKGRVPESLITEQDKLKLQKEQFPLTTKYDKQKFHSAIYHKLIAKTNFTFSEISLHNIEIFMNYLANQAKDFEADLLPKSS